MKRPVALVLTALALLTGQGAHDARAQDGGAATATATSVSVEVIVMQATNAGTGIDPKIGKMPELGRPPLSSYNSYKLLSRSVSALPVGKSATTRLPNSGELLLGYASMIPGKKKEHPSRFLISATIEEPGHAPTQLDVKAKADERLFVAGQKYKGGVLVIGIRVLP